MVTCDKEIVKKKARGRQTGRRRDKQREGAEKREEKLKKGEVTNNRGQKGTTERGDIERANNQNEKLETKGEKEIYRKRERVKYIKESEKERKERKASGIFFY